MNYPKISELVPQGEHFDESAVNEGVWISQGHLSAIEKSLAENESAVSTAAASLQVADENNASLSANLTELQTSSAALTATNATQAARITELENEVAALGKQSSGKGTTISTEKDSSVEEVEKPSYAADSNPANEWLDKQMSLRAKGKLS